jgi:FlaA1/EpsC-like NDP-sugar epimerase
MKKIMINNKNFDGSFYTKKNPIVIYGAGEAGNQVKNILEIYDKRKIIFFIDDNKDRIGTFLAGVKIISFEEFINFSNNYSLIDVIIAIPSLSYSKRNFLTKKLLKNNLNVFLLPQKKFIIENKVYLEDIRSVNFHDFFLEKKKFFYKKKNNNIFNKVIIITGGAGSIGSELCFRVLKYKPKKLIVFDISELSIYNLQHKLNNFENIEYIIGDITDTDFLRGKIDEFKVNILIHAAANKHVNILENNVPAAIKNNILGTISVLNSCSSKVKKIIIVSTDKAVKPISVLGITKRVSELISLNYNKIYNKNLNISVIRFGNVFGSKGSAINLFIKQILAGDFITITNKNVRRFFMSLEDACYLITETLKLRENNQIYIFQMGKDFKIINIIKKLFIFLGKNNFDSKKIKEIGLQKGEKLSEILSYSKSYVKTRIRYIIKVKEKNNYNFKFHNNHIENIRNTYFFYNKKKLKNLYKLLIN